MDKLLTQFFNQPMSKFGVRELSRKTKLDTKTVMKYLNQAIKNKIIIKNKVKDKFPKYEANRLSINYRFEKSSLLVKKILRTNLIEHIQDKTKAPTIILFGSVAKGTYHKKSDIDIFVQSNYKKLDLFKYEVKLDRKINIFFEKFPKKIDKALKGNIISGIILSGKIAL